MYDFSKHFRLLCVEEISDIWNSHKIVSEIWAEFAETRKVSYISEETSCKGPEGQKVQETDLRSIGCEVERSVFSLSLSNTTTCSYELSWSPAPGCGGIVTDFWGWDAHEAQLRCPDGVRGDI